MDALLEKPVNTMWILPILLLALTILLSIPLSRYFAWIMEGRYKAPRVLAWFEARLDSGPQGWKQGEFNRSSQHFDIGGCDESSKAAIGSGRTCEDEVTRATARLTSFGETPVLAGDWRRMLKRRSGSESRNFPGGRDTVVSGVWGNATIASLFVRATAFGSLLVVRRA